MQGAMDHTLDAELKADLALLLECLKCQHDNPAASTQALLTISSICSSNSTIKEYFHECGGLQYILDLLSSTTLEQIKESALYCLGCCVERNVFLQKKISTSEVFSNLYSLLTCPVLVTDYDKLSPFSFSALWQITVMGRIFRSCLTSGQPCKVIQEPIPPSSLQLWSSVASSLSMCVNNPQNDDNQRLCASLLPYTVKLLQECQQESVVRPLAAFLGLLVANNVYNQDRVRKCGGLDTIISVVQRLGNQSRRHPQYLSLALHVVTTLDACIADNGANADTAGDHEAVQTLLSLLSLPELDEASQLQVILTLGHLTDLSVSNQTRFIEAGGLPLLLNLMGASEDEEVCKAVKYVLQACVQAVKYKPSGSGDKNELHQRQPYGLQHIHQNDFLPELPQNREENFDSVILNKLNLLTEKLESMERADVSLERQNTRAVSTAEVLQNQSVKNISNSAQASFEEFLRNWNPKTGKTHERNMDFPQEFAHIYNSQVPVNSGKLSFTQRNIPSQEILNEKEGFMLTDIVACPSFDSSTVNLSVNVPKEQLRSENENSAVVSSGHNVTKVCQTESRKQDENAQPVGRPEQPLRGNGQKEGKKHSEQTQMVQPQSEQLLEELKQEKEKRKLLEIEAASLREAVEKQKQKESEAVALRKELEKQESEVIVSSSSEGSNEHGNELEEAFVEVIEDPPPEESPKFAEKRGNSCMADRNRRSCDKDVFVKPSEPPRVSLRRAQTPAYSSASKTRRCNTRESRNKSSWQDKRTPKESCSRPASQASTCGVDLNDSIASEFDFKLLAKARSAGELKERVAGLSRASYEWSVRKLKQPLTSTPVYRTYHGRFSYGGSLHDNQVYSVKPKRSGPGHLCRGQASWQRGRSADRDIWREGERDSSEDDDDEMSCKSAISVSSFPSRDLCPGCHIYCKFVLVFHSPGCYPPRACGLPLLNSRTFNIALETNPHTCAAHRLVRKLERQFIHTRNQRPTKMRPLEALNGRPTRHGCGDGNGKCPKQPSPSVYDFMSNTDDTPQQSVTPPYQTGRTCPTADIQPKPCVGARRRKPRVPYTEVEIHNLLTGVQKLGKHWNQILCTYQFHPSRTAVDLMEKYKRIMLAEKNQESRESVRRDQTFTGPFSLCEERRLKRGVKQFGYNWKLILEEFRFAEGRTKQQLRDKWRSMHKGKLTKLA
ncbi:uncharacterized protein LOC135478241 [Liolophura sinensis]|uniref:uncharacterized protein LOC135478241 n=1 Tax=Liolophura sinensis TaxID=3198878 RepID=UPI003158E3E0